MYIRKQQALYIMCTADFVLNALRGAKHNEFLDVLKIIYNEINDEINFNSEEYMKAIKQSLRKDCFKNIEYSLSVCNPQFKQERLNQIHVFREVIKAIINKSEKNEFSEVSEIAYSVHNLPNYFLGVHDYGTEDIKEAVQKYYRIKHGKSFIHI